VDLRAVRPVLAVVMLVLAACGKPESVDTGPAEATPGETAGVRYDKHAAGELVPPGEARVNPLGGDANAARQGEALFAAMNCDGCHGGGGVGFVGPSLVDGRWRYGGDDAAVFRSIMDGRPNGMPAYGGMLGDTAVWQLVTYVRAQPMPAYVPTLSWSDE